MNGILLINKPQDYTSHDVVNIVRKFAREQTDDKKIKVGHAGTLDPLATGVLPICIGRTTKFVDFISGLSKQYKATFKLGITTDTQDITGNIVVETPVIPGLTRNLIEECITSFIGPQTQIPPMYSAIKKDGKKLYELARQGKDIERTPREITINNIEILNINLPEIEILVSCSKGTYIRTLCHDIGQKLGCGATLTKLTRTKVGFFDISECHPLPDSGCQLSDMLVPISTVIGTFDGVHLGHQKLLELAQNPNFKVCALVIEPDDSAGCELTTEEEKKQYLHHHGADIVIPVPLKSIKTLSPEEFFDEYIIKRLNTKILSVGFNFHFGRNKSGDINLLQKLCEKNNIELRVLDPVLVDGEIISSTGLKKRNT